MDSSPVKEYARQLGADAVGIADLARLRDLPVTPPDLLDGYSRAVSVALRLSDAILDQIIDAPTPLYGYHYQVVNRELDRIALYLTQYLRRQGGRALPIPASQTLDPVRNIGHISSKAVARAAGIGWQGKSLLIINPDFGPRFRLVTVLTDLPITADALLPNRCGTCTACADACPIGAIHGLSFADHPPSREAAVDIRRCGEHLRHEFAKIHPAVDGVCGVCVRACPWGKPKTSPVPAENASLAP